jgi:hypothetical protein
LLSHIKAPAQGGKAGSGKPPASEFNKDETRFQANWPLSLTFEAKNLELSIYCFPWLSDNLSPEIQAASHIASGTIFDI